jgi:hypothetical protein
MGALLVSCAHGTSGPGFGGPGYAGLPTGGIPLATPSTSAATVDVALQQVDLGFHELKVVESATDIAALREHLLAASRDINTGEDLLTPAPKGVPRALDRRTVRALAAFNYALSALVTCFGSNVEQSSCLRFIPVIQRKARRAGFAVGLLQRYGTSASD